MTAKPWAGFIADFPDDEVEGGDGQMEILGGRNVAVALGETLTKLGCQVSMPYYDGLNGWVFELYYRRHRFWCQLTSFHPAFYLLFDDRAITRGTRARNAAAHAEIWRKFADTLEKDPRFHDIEWRSKEDGPPDPQKIGEANAREMAGKIPPEPLEDRLRPQQVPTRWNGIGCLLVGAAISIGVCGALIAVDGVRDLSQGRFDAKSELLVGIGVFCLSGLSVWALARGLRRHRPAAGDETSSSPTD